MDRARGDLDVATLRREVVEVREVTLTGVALTLEEARGGSNYDAIVVNLGRRAPPPADAPGPSVRVHDLYVREITATVRLAPAPAPPITLDIPRDPPARPRRRGRRERRRDHGRGRARDPHRGRDARTRACRSRWQARLLTGLGLSGAAEVLRDIGERGLDAVREALRGVLE